jgi:hypothetical protein
MFTLKAAFSASSSSVTSANAEAERPLVAFNSVIKALRDAKTMEVVLEVCVPLPTPFLMSTPRIAAIEPAAVPRLAGRPGMVPMAEATSEAIKIAKFTLLPS